MTAGSLLVRLASAAVVLVLALAILDSLPVRDGLVGLARILAPHLALAGLVAAGIVLVGAGRGPRIVALALVVATVARFGGEWLSLPAPGSPELRVVSWNLELGSRAPALTVDRLRSVEADIVALQELTPATADAIEADPELRARFPTRLLVPVEGVAGMGILSTAQRGEASFATEPVRQDARLTFGGRTLRVLNVHPFPARISLGPFGLPTGIDPTGRDTSLGRLRAVVDAAAEAGEPIDLVVGDLNASPLEAGYRELAAGFADAHAEVGIGPGWTWRPSRFEGFGIGLLRIDTVLLGPRLRPLTADTDCSVTGDHCLLIVEVERRGA